jgi:hypothetical protein
MSSDLQDSTPPSPDELAEYGIERVPVDYFHWKGFRYTSLKDAVAAARRERRSGSSDA